MDCGMPTGKVLTQMSVSTPAVIHHVGTPKGKLTALK